MKFDDIQSILPDQLKTAVANRKLLVIFLLVLVLLASLVVIMTSLTIHYALRQSSASTPSLLAQTMDGRCVSPHCLMVASNLLQNAAETGTEAGFTGDRCDDFYRYSCAGWSASRTMPADNGYTSSLFELWHRNEEKLRDAIEMPIKRNTPESSERKLKELFRMCLHDYGRIKTGGGELVRIVRDELPGSYLLDPQNWQSTWRFENSLVVLQRDYLVNALFELRVELSTLEREKNIIAVHPGGMGMLQREYTSKSSINIKVANAYKDYIRDSATLFLRDAGITLSDSEKQARLDQFVSDAFNQEMALAAAMADARKNIIWRSRLMTLSQMSQNYSQVPWLSVIPGVFANSGVNDGTLIRVMTPLFFRQLNAALVNESQANIRDRMLNNYFVWRLIDTYANHLSWEYRQAKFRFREVREGIEEFLPVWEECLNTVGSRMGVALAAEFLSAHIGLAKKDKISALYDSIRDSFVEYIDEIPWLSEESKPLAKNKINSIQTFIAFPEDYFNITYVDSILSQVTINRDDGYFRNLLNTNHHLRNQYTAKLKAGYQFFMWQRVFNRGGFGVYPSYFRQFNDIIIPAGCLQLPMYSDLGPQYLNYAAIGAGMAENMLYAINEVGRMYSPNGTSWDWWSANTTVQYTAAINCTADYLSGLSAGPYIVEGEPKTAMIDGRSNARDTMVIIAGLRVAFKAYRKWAAQNTDISLPISLNNDQAFFLTATQTYCFLERDEAAFEYVNIGGIPDDIRMNAVLKMMPEFAEVFQCSKRQQSNQCNPV